MSRMSHADLPIALVIVKSAVVGSPAAVRQTGRAIEVANTTTTIRDEAIKGALYGDCSDEDVARAKLLLMPYLAGREAVNAWQRLTHSRSWSSSAKPAGSM